jgi:hypothetical protein
MADVVTQSRKVELPFASSLADDLPASRVELADDGCWGASRRRTLHLLDASHPSSVRTCDG